LRITLLTLVMFILIWITLGWVGRWLGLRMRHPGFAPMASLALVLAPPILMFSLACYCADQWHLNRLPDRMFAPLMMWVTFGIGAGHCLRLSWWAASRLRRDFRRIVTSRFQPAALRPWWRPGRRRLLRLGFGCIAVGAALPIIIFSFYGYQNWHSRRAWSRFQKELKQRNETLDVAALLPGPVSASQNFALTPAFRNWVHPNGSNAATRTLVDKLKQFDLSNTQPGSITPGMEWAKQTVAPLGDYLAWLEPTVTFHTEPSRGELAHALLQSLHGHEATMRELTTAAHLPYFQTSTNGNASAVLYPTRIENAALERLHMLFQVRACAVLVTNRNAEAAEDLMSGLQLVRLARQIQDAKSPMRAQVLLGRSVQPLWEGLIQHRWTEAQLAAFQNELGQFNLLADYTNALRRVARANIENWQKLAQRKSTGFLPPAGYGDSDDSVWQMQPRAWWLENCMQLYQVVETAIGNVDVAGGRVFLDGRWSDLDGLPLDSDSRSLFQQTFWGASPWSVVFAQTAVNQAILACALERYRLAHQHYPERLEQLMPEYSRTIPNDVVRGRPMLYENAGDGRFILWSVGPNQTDDHHKLLSDDWVWSFPTNAPAGVVR
jgi:hypothetical protein